MNTLRKIIIILSVSIHGTLLMAQRAMVTSGGLASGGSGSVSFTIGQMVYQSVPGISCETLHGMQLPFETLYNVGIEDNRSTGPQCLVYPNPTNSHVTLKIEHFRNEHFRFELYDLQGKLIQNHKISDAETLISMNSLLPAVYFLKVIGDEKATTSFKIIKNH